VIRNLTANRDRFVLFPHHTATNKETMSEAAAAETASASALVETTINPSKELNKNANHVYIMDDTCSWIPAQVIERPNDISAVVNVPIYPNEQSIQCDGGKHARTWERRNVDLNLYANQALPLQNVNSEGTLQAVEDMVDLPFLHEVSDSIAM
jgi:hypothetical protein